MAATAYLPLSIPPSPFSSQTISFSRTCTTFPLLLNTSSSICSLTSPISSSKWKLQPYIPLPPGRLSLVACASTSATANTARPSYQLFVSGKESSSLHSLVWVFPMDKLYGFSGGNQIHAYIGSIGHVYFCSGLSFRTTEESLRNAFQSFGELIEVNLVMDRIANRPRGFAFLRYATEEESKMAIEGMHGKFLDGRVIFVEVAKPKSELRQNSKPVSRPFY